MTEEGVILRVTRDLKAAVSAILQGYGDRQGPVTDASAELHSVCGCLELLLQFDQKEQRSFLGARKDYWDFLLTALRRQRAYEEQIRYICSQDKLKTSLGKGRAFIRLCLARGQLAESLQLCLLSPELTREWYGPRSPLLCPELWEDILDSLYALNGVAFNLDLQRPDLDGAWPMFSESRCSNSSRTQGKRLKKTKGFTEEVGHSEEQLQRLHTREARCLQDVPREDRLPGLRTSLQHEHLLTLLEKMREDARSPSCPLSTWEPHGEELQLDQEKGSPKVGKLLENSMASIQQQRKGAKEVTGIETEGPKSLPGTEAQRTAEGTRKKEVDQGHDQGLLAHGFQGRAEDRVAGSKLGQTPPSILGWSRVLQGLGTDEGHATEKSTAVISVTRQEDQAEVALQDMVKGLRHGLQQTEERAQHQEQLLQAQEGELQMLREQLIRCRTEKAQLQAELGQKQQDTERRIATYEEELAGQRDLVQAMKRRVLELIQEKDRQWQRLQQLSAMAPGHCVGCSKVFGLLSRRYPCRLCGTLVCHACSADYKKRERCCPPCAQREETQVT